LGAILQTDATADNIPDTDCEAQIPLTEGDLVRSAKGLRVILLRMTRDLELAKDLTQDILESTMNSIRAGRLIHAGALPSYLYTCAKRAVYAHARRQVPRASDEVLAMIEAGSTPFDHCEQVELAALAQRVLAQLHTERDRALIRDFYISGMSKSALMATWHLDSDHFDKVLSRARGRMRELLQEKLNAGTTDVSGSHGTRLDQGTRKPL
jgi:RNA polymerase sigma factor (sigma-70 family)